MKEILQGISVTTLFLVFATYVLVVSYQKQVEKMHSKQSLRVQTIEFFRKIIKQRRNMIRFDHSRKINCETSISKLEMAITNMTDSQKAAYYLDRLSNDILNVMPRTAAKSNKWLDRYSQLKQIASEIMYPNMQHS